MGWCTAHPEGCLLHVTVKPNAKATAVTGLSGPEDAPALAIRLAAKPVEGEANTTLIAFLSKALGIPKSRLSLHRGQTGRHKQVLINGTPPEEACTRLAPLIPADNNAA